MDLTAKRQAKPEKVIKLRGDTDYIIDYQFMLRGVLPDIIYKVRTLAMDQYPQLMIREATFDYEQGRVKNGFLSILGMNESQRKADLLWEAFQKYCVEVTYTGYALDD